MDRPHGGEDVEIDKSEETREVRERRPDRRLQTCNSDLKRLKFAGETQSVAARVTNEVGITKCTNETAFKNTQVVTCKENCYCRSGEVGRVIGHGFGWVGTIIDPSEVDFGVDPMSLQALPCPGDSGTIRKLKTWMEKRGREAREISFHDQQVLKTAKAMEADAPWKNSSHRQGVHYGPASFADKAAVSSLGKPLIDDQR
ncbi:hypothetical protein EDD15DRAFT_2192443 [Pisolithus albus]|nr:hypothetical protein EDD15DRAFT_2192443 [Pisolithus albus]